MAATASLRETAWVRDLSAPALGVTGCPATALPRARAGFTTRFLPGERMATPKQFFREYALAFQLPGAGDPGWSGLDDWMRDLSWLGQAEGYCTVVQHADQLLSSDEEAFRLFAESVPFWADYWRDSAAQGELGVTVRDVPFRVLLHTEPERLPLLSARLDRAGAAWAAVLPDELQA